MAAASIKLGCATGCVNWKVEMSELVCHFRSCWKHGCFSSEKWRVIVDLSLACAAQRPQFRILAFSISAFILFGEVMPWWRIQFENSKLATFRLSAVNYGRSSHSISVVISIRAVQCWWFMCSCKRAGNVTSCSLPTFGPPFSKKKKKEINLGMGAWFDITTYWQNRKIWSKLTSFIFSSDASIGEFTYEPKNMIRLLSPINFLMSAKYLAWQH